MAENIDPAAITSAPLESGNSATVPVNGDPLCPDPRLAQELGFLGRLFGHGDTARTNIAGTTAVVFTLLLILCIVISVAASDAEVRQKVGSLITPIFGVITGVIGYITGKKTG